jgi:hypothetical protein
MIIFNNTLAEIETKSAGIIENYHNFDRTEDRATVFLTLSGITLESKKNAHL